MFGIGMSELFVICCVVIIFIRPKDFPIIFRRLGRLYARWKTYYRELASVSEQIVLDIQKEANVWTPADDSIDTPGPTDPSERVFPEPEARGPGANSEEKDSR